MEVAMESAEPGKVRHPPYWWAVSAVAVLGLLLLIVDHWAHVLGVLPYLVLLACPLMHVFMHRGHGHGGRPKEHGD
jgi:hypothetical protein